MRADELHEHTPKHIGHVNDQSILVTTEIEDHAIVAHEIDRDAELAFYRAWAGPARFRNRCEPGSQRSFCLRMPLPELPKRPAGNDLHKLSISCHQNDDNHADSSDSLRLAA